MIEQCPLKGSNSDDLLVLTLSSYPRDGQENLFGEQRRKTIERENPFGKQRGKTIKRGPEIVSQRNWSLKDKIHCQQEKWREGRTFQRRKQRQMQGLMKEKTQQLQGIVSRDGYRGKDFFREVIPERRLVELLKKCSHISKFAFTNSSL